MRYTYKYPRTQWREVRESLKAKKRLYWYNREKAIQFIEDAMRAGYTQEPWIRPAHFETIEGLSDDPAYTLSESDPEQEKLWLENKFQKEIDILKQHYTNVVVDWAIVVDGS
jgi:hypothetical protein